MPSGPAPRAGPLALTWAWRRRRVSGVARGQRSARADRPARSHALTRHALAGRDGVTEQPGVAGRDGVTRPAGLPRRLRFRRRGGSAARHALAARGCVAGSGRLPGAPVITGRHGRRRLAAGSIRSAAGTARAHPRLETRARWLRPGPAGGRPVLAPAAGRRSRGRPGARRAQDFRDVLALWGPGRAAIPGHVDEATRRVHVRRVQYGSPGRTRSAIAAGLTAAGRRSAGAEPVLAVPRWLAMPAGSCRGRRAAGSSPVIRRACPRPGPAGSADPRHREYHQDHEAERDARRDHVQPQPGHMRRLMLGHKPHDHARDHQDGADHDRHGSRHRQDDDEPHPPGGGGLRAH